MHTKKPIAVTRRITATLATGGLLAVVACGEATSPVMLNARHESALLAAAADADLRLMPSLDDDARAPFHAGLEAVIAALQNGDATSVRLAVAGLRELVASHRAAAPTDTADADGADLAAVALLADAIESGLNLKEAR